jgi:hypothetical protein
VLAPAGLALLGAALTLLVTVPEWLTDGRDEPYGRPLLVALAWLLFAAAALVSRRIPRQVAVPLILLGAVTMPFTAALVQPGGSDDVYRYIWDGRVQASGIDPYAYPPAATELVWLRDPLLWPEDSAWCVPSGTSTAQGEPLTAGCTLINRPGVPTIYPPAAQLYFRAVHAISPPDALARPFQLAGALLAVAITLLLLLSAKVRGADPRSVILWAWCPAVALEAANDAHVDALAALLTALALLCVSRTGNARWSASGGALLGLAIATKVTPLLVLPALARRRPAVVGLAALGTVVVLYLPHVLSVGPGVVGYLPGYLNEEGFASGTRFALLNLVVPSQWAGAVGAVVLIAIAVLVARSTDPDRPWLGAATMTGAALLVATPTYPWYALLLVLMVGMGARTVWLAVVAAGYLAEYAGLLRMDLRLAQRIGYGLALVAVLIVVVRARRRASSPGTARAEV